MRFRAAVLSQVGQPLEIDALELRGLADTDVLVRIEATSICHTDVEVIDGHLAIPLPVVPGHEGAGIVERVGKGVRSLKVGDFVVLSWNPHCGGCFYCQRDQPILCAQYTTRSGSAYHFDGKPRLFRGGDAVHQLMYTGTFSEYAVVTEQCAVKVPSELPAELACLIGCGVMTGVGAALNVAKVQPGDIATVIGCGAVGLSAVQGAHLAGARRVIAVDRDAGRLDVAKALGATDTLLADPALQETHAAMTDGRGADHVFEAAGNEAGFRSSLELVRPGGHVVWLGKLPPHRQMSLRWGSLMGEKRIVRSSYGGARPQRDFPLLAKACLEGRLQLAPYVTSRIGLEDVNTGVERLRRGLDIRAVIRSHRSV